MEKVLELMEPTQNGREVPTKLFLKGSPYDIVFEAAEIEEKLNRIHLPCYVMKE